MHFVHLAMIVVQAGDGLRRLIIGLNTVAKLLVAIDNGQSNRQVDHNERGKSTYNFIANRYVIVPA